MRLFGLARLTQLYIMYPEHFTKIYIWEDGLAYNYAAYFRKDKTMFAKWRYKQVVEFLLYREWEANNSKEQPETGWKASELWKPLFDNYWEGDHVSEWENIFLFPREYAKEQLESPTALEAARVCTLKTQGKFKAKSDDGKNTLEDGKNTLEDDEINKFWHECLQSQLAPEHRAENMGGQRKMHAAKLVDLLQNHEGKDELKELVDKGEEKWLMALIGMKKGQLYEKVKQRESKKKHQQASSSSTTLEAKEHPESSVTFIEDKIMKKAESTYPSSEPTNNEIEVDDEVKDGLDKVDEAEMEDEMKKKMKEKSKINTNEIHEKNIVEPATLSLEMIKENTENDKQERFLTLNKGKSQHEMREENKVKEKMDKERVGKLPVDEKQTKATILKTKRGKISTSKKKPVSREMVDQERQKHFARVEMEKEKRAKEKGETKSTTA